MARKKLTEQQKNEIKNKKLLEGLFQGKTPINNVIEENSKLEEMFKIFDEYDLKPVDENVRPDTDKQRFIKYFNDKKKTPKEIEYEDTQRAILSDRIIQTLKENKQKYEEKQKENKINAIKDATKETIANIIYGTGKGISDSGAGLLGLFYNLPTATYKKIQDPENNSFSEELLKDNIFFEEQRNFNNLLADALNVKDAWETDNKEDKQLQFIGQFAIPQNYLKKGFKPFITETNPAKLKRMEGALNFVLPGPQVTDNASLKQKAIEIGGQLPLAVGFDELMSYFAKKQGVLNDYRDNTTQPVEQKDKNNLKQITLIDNNSKIGKKLFIEDLDPSVIRNITFNDDEYYNAPWKKYSPFHNKSGELNGLGYVTIGAGGLLATSVASRVLKNVKQSKLNKLAETTDLDKDPVNTLANLFSDEKDINNKNDLSPLMQSLNSEPHNIRKQLDGFERFENSVADKMNFIDKMKQRGQLSDDVLAEVSQDIYSQIDAKFSTGIFDKDIKTNVSPLLTKQKIFALKTNNPEYYNKLEELLEISSIIQDETNRVNKFVLNRQLDMSPDEYIKARGSNKLDIKESINYRSTKNLLELKGKHTELLNELRSIPQTNTIINEISDISNAMLKVLEKSGIYSQRSIDLLKKNRSFNGFMSYKPRKEVIDQTFSNKLDNLLFNRADNKFRTSDIFQIRTEGSVGNGQNYLDLLENDIKSTLLDIHNNSITKKFVEDALPKQSKTLNKVLDDTAESKISILANKHDSFDEVKNKLNNLNKKTLAKVNDAMIVRPVGVENLDELNTHAKPKSFFDIINRKQVDDDWLSNSLNQIFGESEDKFSKTSKNFQTRNDIIAYRENGNMHYFQVDPIIAKAFSSNPELPGIIGRGIRWFRDLRQQMITGKLNPTFSVPSAFYTTEENLVALGKIADELNIAFDKNLISRKDYIKEIGTAFNELTTQQQTKDLLNIFNEEYIKNFGKLNGLLDQKMFEVTQQSLQNNINNSLLTKIQLAGGASSKPFNVNTGVYYTLNKDTVLSNKVREAILKSNSLNNAKKLLNIIDYTQTALREAPSIGLVQYLSKVTGAISDNNIVDYKKFNEILRLTSKYTATMGKRGSHLGSIGAMGKAIENYFPYGHVMIQSLAPKSRGLKIGTGIKNIKKDVSDLFNPEISYSEVFSNIKNQIKSASGNKYIQAAITGASIPAMMAYVWNYATQENANAFHGISDYDKASKLILTNALGKDKHLFIPMDQEYAIIYSLTYNLLDSLLGMSGINQIDPAFKSNKLLLNSLSRSLFVDEIAGIDLLSATMGKRFNINPLDERLGIDDIKKDIINPNLEETAYENGVLSNYSINIINTIFGTLGRALTDAIEEGNAGLNVDTFTGITDSSKAILNDLFSSGKLVNNKFTSYNETSKYVYDKILYVNKLSKIANKMNDDQKKVYDLIKSYRKNRISPLHKQLTQLLKVKQHVKANGFIDGEQISLDYEGRKIKMQDIDKAISRLFALEYQEYEDLNKIIEQQFGKGLSLETFAGELVYE